MTQIPEKKSNSFGWDRHSPTNRPMVTISLLLLTGFIETGFSYWGFTLSMRTLPPSNIATAFFFAIMMLCTVNIFVAFFLSNRSFNASRIGMGVNAILAILNAIGFARILFSIIHIAILIGLLDLKFEKLPQTFPSFSKEL